jgi:hypothetical protein
VLVIDEIETLLDKFQGDFLEQGAKQFKSQIWEIFIELFKSAEKIVLLDAFITKKTLNFLDSLNIENVVYERKEEPTTRTVQFMSSYMYMVSDIIEKLNNGKKVFIFYPFKKSSSAHNSMESLKKTIEEKTGKQGQYYNADVDDTVKKELKDVNENWSRYDFVITNNIITCGVNYEKTDFDHNYLLIASHNSPRDIIQVSYRLRFLSSGIINVCYVGRMTPQNTWLNDCAKINCPIYSALFADILVEKKAPTKRTFQLFCEKAHYKMKTDNTIVNEAIEKELKDMLEKGNANMTYANIPQISFEQMEELQVKCMNQIATMDDKFQLNKYFFRKQFIRPDEPEKKEFLELKLGEIWDEKYDVFIRRLKTVITDEDNIFNEIAKNNEYTKIFPTEVKKLKLNEELRERIFKEFSFKFITKMSASSKITKEIYNLYFNKTIVNTEYDKNKHAIYSVDESVFELHDFVKEYMRDCKPNEHDKNDVYLSDLESIPVEI